MLLTIALIIAALWLLGFIGGVGSSFIHILLVVALVLFIASLLTGRRSV